MAKLNTLVILCAVFFFFLTPYIDASYAQSQQTVETAIGTVAPDGEGGSNAGRVYFFCQYGAVNQRGVLRSRCTWNIQPGTSGYCSYGNPPPSSNQCDIAGTGCGPTSFAMIMSTLGDRQTPTQVALASNKYAGCGGQYGGTDWNDIWYKLRPWMERKGFTITGNLVSGGKINAEAARRYLDRGYLIVGGAYVRYMRMEGWGSTYEGHAFVVSGYNISNPNTFEGYDPTFCEGDGFGGFRTYSDVNNPENPKRDGVKSWIFATAIKKGG